MASILVRHRNSNKHVGTAINTNDYVITLYAFDDGDLELELLSKDLTQKVYYSMSNFSFFFNGLELNILEVLGLNLLSEDELKKSPKKVRKILNKRLLSCGLSTKPRAPIQKPQNPQPQADNG